MSAETGENRTQQFRQGIIACIPTLLGYWAIGFACGAIGKVSGFGVLEVTLLSAFLYAGSAHFMFYSLASAGTGTFMEIANITFAVAFINIRYLLINTYMAQFFSHATLREKLIGSLLITDETFGVASNHANKNGGTLPFYWLLGLNLTAWLNWVFSTVAGCLFASFLPIWLQDSLSFSLVGMFIGLLLLSWFASRTRLLDIVVVLVAIFVIICTHTVMSENTATIAATLVAATTGLLLLMYMWRRKNTP